VRWARLVARIGTTRIAYKTPESKRPFGRSRRRWDDNVEIDFKEE
jgi:hypothetical protein